MGNKRNRRSRNHETPSPDRGLSETRIETPIQGNETLDDVNTVIQGPLGEDDNGTLLIEPSQISNEIQARQKTLNKRTTTE